MATIKRVFPGKTWEVKPAEQLSFSDGKLRDVRRWLEYSAGGLPYRVVVVRGGHIAAEWEKDVPHDLELPLASASKSVYSCLLGIVEGEGKIGSSDDKVVDYYPEIMDVPSGTGPKPGRYAFPKDRDITFRHLITNTSGYMKPGEEPGKVYHYQTFGMNIVTHALAKLYGLYDTDDPFGLLGCGRLIQEKIRDPIGGTWGYLLRNFKLPLEARTEIFGNYTDLYLTTGDMARLGYLWLNGGNWDGIQVVPADYLEMATKTAPDILTNSPEADWRYGHAFWTNDHGKLWPSLPRDSFAASGAHRKHIWMCPSMDIVVAQSPGIFTKQDDEVNTALLERVVAASLT